MLTKGNDLTRMTGLLQSLIAVAIFSTPTWAQQKPNIVVIMDDDIGMWNIGAQHCSLMAGRTSARRPLLHNK